MSAYKTAYIRIGEAEYKKLREAETQLRLNNMLQAKSTNELMDEQSSIYENMMGIKHQNDQNFQNLVVDIEGEINRIENEASTWVENQADKLRTEYIKYRDDLQDQTSTRIKEMADLANQKMAQQEIQFQEYWMVQEDKIASLENKWNAYEALALDWVRKDQEILDFIYNTYSIEAYEANQLEMQRQYLNQVIQQYNNGFFDLAAAAGFQIFISLSNIRFEMEFNRSIQAIHLQKLYAKEEELQRTLANCQTVHAMDNDGNELPEVIDVDYWVEGHLQECARNIETLIQNIHANDFIDLNQIAQYSQQINEYSDQVLDLVTQARLVVLASQLRFNVAQIVVQSLESQGFFLEQAHYEKDDYRESFTAKTCNYAGNEVMVIIDPDPGLDEGGKIHIHSLDASQITEHELLQRNLEIFTAIQENGIEVENIQTVPSTRNNLIPRERIGKKIDKNNLKIGEEKISHGRN